MTSSLIQQRAATHGDYTEVAELAQALKAMFRLRDGWSRLSVRQRESLDSIAVKIARALHGDPAHDDTWADIGGYAELARGGA